MPWACGYTSCQLSARLQSACKPFTGLCKTHAFCPALAPYVVSRVCFAVAGIAAANVTLPLTPAGSQAAQLYSSTNNASNISGSSAWPLDQGAAAQGMASALLGNARKVR
jgi:hypothetical protein